MNVLILTPDAVGSTLLQRMLTIYMQFHEFDRPVINLHELTNGLEKYYSTDFNREILGKPLPGRWGYYQSLEEIVQTLESVDHYKTSRLAHYHIRNRADSIAQQIPFYQYINDNFYVISCRRQNVFEHALSWAINKITGKLNVYDPQEKVMSFLDLYKDGVTVDSRSFVASLESYREYLNWVEQHFQVASYFNYETDIPRLEEYILNLPVFSGQSRLLSWKETFGISFQDWNRCHYLTSDVGSAVLERPQEFWALINSLDSTQLENAYLSTEELLRRYNKVADATWPSISNANDFMKLPKYIQDECRQEHQIIVNPGSVSFTKNLINLFDDNRKNFLAEHISNYGTAKSCIDQMQKLGIIINGPPIKKHTLLEKKHMVKNYNELMDTYNQWAEKNPTVALPVNSNLLDEAAQKEKHYWHSTNSINQLTVDKTTD